MRQYLSRYFSLLHCNKYDPLFLYRQLGGYTRQINDLLKTEPFLSFDQHSKSFSITNHDLTWDQKISLRRSLMSKLREIRPMTSVKIDEVVTGYYDQCLERYLFERQNRSMPNEDTCWFKRAQNNKCIGWRDPKKVFDLAEKSLFLKRLGEQKPYFRDEKLIYALERDEGGYIFLRSNNTYKDDDRVILLYRDILKNGYKNIISSLSPIILGYSTNTRRYNAISGRHRIAALRYLKTQGILSGSLKIKCHVVKYPFESLLYSRPYSGVCKKCDWGGILDPGQGTHQDFFIREGIGVMRGRPNRKGGRQKWNRMRPVFGEMVSNKKVLDVGAHRGLFCYKALEFGAKKVTALEPNPELAQIIDKIRVSYAFEDLKVVQGDFYNSRDYESLVHGKYDTVLLFGVIHHLLRLGIQKGVLYSFEELFERISKLANYGAIVEFALPRESSLMLPELLPHRDAFSQEKFERALQSNFKYWRNLGRCNYKSGNKYWRFMYYAKSPIHLL